MKKFLMGVVLAVLIATILPTKEAQAIAAWARKYSADCTMCHTMYPRLNQVGHKFRRLGYRLPDEFDSKDAKLPMDELSKFTNYLSARARPRVALSKTMGSPSNFRFQMEDVTLFYAGPVTRNVGFFFELPFEPADEKGFLEVGQILLNFGSSDRFFFMRAGQFHQLSSVGYGGLDRPIGLSRSAVVQTTINGFRPRQDGIGFEGGYSFNNFTGLVQVTNGITAGGATQLDNTDQNRAKDVKVLLEYMIPDHDASVSAAYVYGAAPTPTALAVALPGTARNLKYNRFYFFGDYTFEKIGLKPIVGGSIGIDNEFSGGTFTTVTNSRSWLAFLELDQKIIENLYAVGRFDYYEPTNKDEGQSATTKTWSGSGAFVWRFQEFLRTTLEYQLTDNKFQRAAHSLTGELQLVF